MELLAPAGNWDSFIAALKNGADAVYLGGQQYSARQSALNFDDKQIQEAVTFAHLRDKRVYVTVNTLIDNSEFSEVLDYLFKLQQYGVDAIIIQDMGLLDAVRNTLPDLRLHASTQMTIHNQDGADFLQKRGVKRIVLARELSMNEISAIKKEVDEVELEVFVHGALCYCFSGQCLFSSMVGGRSGNRGRCAQPCRLPYELYSRDDQQKVKLDDQGKYLLSPADLCLIEYLPELESAGVSSLKIEGRMKRPEYVAVVTRAYRQVLDAVKENPDFRPEPSVKERLLKIFNRNFSSGYFIPESNEFLSTRRPNNRGVYVGRIVDQNREMLTRIKLSDTVSLGDGLVVWVGQGQGPAAIIKEMKVEEKTVSEARSGQIIEIQLDGRVSLNDRVFKTHDQKLISEARESMSTEEGFKIPVNAEVFLHPGETMKLILVDHRGIRAEAETKNLAQPADHHPLNREILMEKVGRLGNTSFLLKDIRVHGDQNVLVPLSDINDARRRAIDLLNNKILRKNKPASTDDHNYWYEKDRYLNQQPARKQIKKTLLSVAVSNPDQAIIALQNGADQVYLGMEGLGVHRHLSRPDIQKVLEKSTGGPNRIIPILPRIHMPDDKYSYREIIDQSFSTIMISSWADLKWSLNNGFAVLVDYTLNIFNRYTLRYLYQQGVDRVCLTPELNFNQLQTFEDYDRIELLVHGELIMLESQYCMLGGVMGGKNKNCKAPCKGKDYYIKDTKGFEFPLETDADCKFYIFNSRTLCMIEDLPRILALEPASIRIEARRISNKQLVKTIKLYREALDIILNGSKPDLTGYMQDLNAAANSSFTKGHYYRGVL